MAVAVALPPEITAALVVGAAGLIGTAFFTAKAWLGMLAAKASAAEAQAQAAAAKAKADLAAIQAATANERVSNVSQAQSAMRSDLTAVALNTPTPAPSTPPAVNASTMSVAAGEVNVSGPLDKPKGN